MVLPSIARTYADANANKPNEFWDYDSYVIDWQEQENYRLLRSIGKGKSSEVFEAYDLINNKKCAIKCLKPRNKIKIKREVKILETLKGGKNIIELLAAVKNPLLRTRGLVFEYVDNMQLRLFFPWMTDGDIRYYIYQLLLALDFCHSLGIMHRDVKPRNVLFDYTTKNLKLIDWGLSDFYRPGKEYSVHVASKHFKGPELLVEYHMYDYSLDIWSLGCLFATMIFQISPFFNGKDNVDQLIKITRVLGTQQLFVYLSKFNIDINPGFIELMGTHPKKTWEHYVNRGNQHLISPEAFNLLDKFLCYDHSERLTAREAMEHPYFYPLSQSSRSVASI